MKHPARLILAAQLATALGGSGFVMAAETAVAQDLVTVQTSDHVRSATWVRLPDSYRLQLVLDAAYTAPVNVSEALKQLVPRKEDYGAHPIPNWRPGWELDGGAENAERGSRFIADTIASLRAMDPAFRCGLVFAGDAEARRIDVWLLRADGSRIEPATSACEKVDATGPDSTGVALSYGFSIADSAEAVAAAVRINDDFTIEKLQPLVTPPAAR